MATHPDPHAIITLALRGESHPHIMHCAACRTLHEQACSLIAFDPDTAADLHHPDDTNASAYPAPGYRLAAQDALVGDGPVVMRRTWYLDNATVLVRVMEDRNAHCLYGHVITDPDRLAGIAIRFSGLDTDFLPDETGMFRIGADDLEIESMDAVIHVR